MGDYASQADLKTRFEDDAAVAHLTDTADSGTPDSSVLDEVIDHAEGEIDSYVAVRYLVPVAVANNAGLAAMMKSVTLDMAVYHLYARHHGVSEVVQGLYDKAIEWLKLIAAGEAVLPTPDTEAPTTSQDPVIAWGTADGGTSTSRIFSRATQDGL